MSTSCEAINLISESKNKPNIVIVQNHEKIKKLCDSSEIFNKTKKRFFKRECGIKHFTGVARRGEKFMVVDAF